jgi:hypothetical protein
MGCLQIVHKAACVTRVPEAHCNYPAATTPTRAVHPPQSSTQGLIAPALGDFGMAISLFLRYMFKRSRLHASELSSGIYLLLIRPGWIYIYIFFQIPTLSVLESSLVERVFFLYPGRMVRVWSRVFSHIWSLLCRRVGLPLRDGFLLGFLLDSQVYFGYWWGRRFEGQEKCACAVIRRFGDLCNAFRWCVPQEPNTEGFRQFYHPLLHHNM